MPLYYKGKTKFTPIHVTDLSNIIFEIVKKKITGETIECIGPQVFTFKELITKILKSINKKRLLIQMPLPLAKLNAKLFQLMPKPLLTMDQLKLLKYDNIISKKYKTNFDMNMEANKKFEDEINRYSFNWSSGGQFSKKELKDKLMLSNIIYIVVFLILAFVLSIAVKAITRGVEAKQAIKEEEKLDVIDNTENQNLQMIDQIKNLKNYMIKELLTRMNLKKLKKKY